MSDKRSIAINVPKLPKSVIEHLEYLKNTGVKITEVNEKTAKSEVIRWFNIRGNDEVFALAWVTGEWEVLEDHWYAKIKSWEHVDKSAEKQFEFDKKNGEQGLAEDPSWYRSVYIIQQMDGNLIVDMKDSGLRGAKHSMTMDEWAKLGINETNAVFEKVEERLLWRKNRD